MLQQTQHHMGFMDWVYLLLWGVEVVIVLVAAVDSLRWKPGAYAAAGKLTKQKWVAILGIALLFVLLAGWSGASSLIGIAAVVAGAVYLADVRPAVKGMSGRGGGGTRMGPYGPW
ncbi:uncharacterized protein DUF2516 [Motilibacter rhizosphaerae]|uniref:Uncharacterized protein DUF2516 n=1 Tax=Motilibacter rhizosphaerae TaxID=598652 RepID=A0A4Q7NQJ7_9ACTN|nr:DUF2516 family protein [Motilibacter rhizosphaerae]RZS87615.1 uncharacterized protein DUF2516 [Motilibacter rhizosphaerae]